ncbi:hypothetical protein ACLB1O_27120 [Escherichia coli]
MAEVTPDTIRYYEKQQMMEHECILKVVSPIYRKRSPAIEIYPPCQTTGFRLESIRELLSDPHRS